MNKRAHEEQNDENPWKGSSVSSNMDKLQFELSRLEKYKGQNKLNRPPLFNYFNKDKSRNVDEIIGQIDEVQEEQKKEQIVKTIKAIETSVQEQEFKLYDPNKKDHVRTKLKIMFVTFNLGGRPMGSGRKASE